MRSNEGIFNPVAAGLLLLLLLVMPQAKAVCTPSPAGTFNGEVLEGKYVTFSFPSTRVSVPRDLPVGGIIARAPISSLSGNGLMGVCDEGRIINAVRALDGRMVGTTESYLQQNGQDTGVAFRIQGRNGTPVVLSSTRISEIRKGAGVGSINSVIREHYAEIVLVKVAEQVRPGTVFSSGLKLQDRSRQATTLTSWVEVSEYHTDAPVTIVPQSCQVTMPTSVSLGNHQNTAFRGIGSVSPASSFSININCAGTPVAVYMTMSDPANSSNRGNTLPLTAASMAKGLGVQILRADTDTLVNFGPDSSAQGTPNQMKIFDATQSRPSFSANFKARYIQTAQTVTPGNANSVVTFTMSYQ